MHIRWLTMSGGCSCLKPKTRGLVFLHYCAGADQLVSSPTTDWPILDPSDIPLILVPACACTSLSCPVLPAALSQGRTAFWARLKHQEMQSHENSMLQGGDFSCKGKGYWQRCWCPCQRWKQGQWKSKSNQRDIGYLDLEDKNKKKIKRKVFKRLFSFDSTLTKGIFLLSPGSTDFIPVYRKFSLSFCKGWKDNYQWANNGLYRE